MFALSCHIDVDSREERLSSNIYMFEYLVKQFIDAFILYI